MSANIPTTSYVMSTSFTSKQILDLIDSHQTPFSDGGVLGGVIFMIDTDNGDEFIKAYRVEWDISGNPVYDPKASIRGKNQEVVSQLPGSFKDIAKFDLVFFDKADLEILCHYVFTKGTPSKGIVLQRFLRNENGIPFQSLTAYTNPMPYTKNMSLNPEVNPQPVDLSQSIKTGVECPPVWKSVSVANLSTFSANDFRKKSVTTGELYEALKKQIK